MSEAAQRYAGGMRRRAVRAAMWAWVGALAVAGVGCVERTITVTSEPAGALVHLNDEPIGRTPVQVPFTFYGVYDVRLEAEGHEPLWTAREADAPWWETPPIDLFAEATGAKVQLDWHFELPPAQPTDDTAVDRLLDHARQMRARVGRD